VSDIIAFFENLNGFFEDEFDLVADIPCSVHKNEESGEIEEIRIYNPEYDQLIFITKSGVVNFINISDEKDRLEKLARENRVYAPRTRKTKTIETPPVKKPRSKKSSVEKTPEILPVKKPRSKKSSVEQPQEVASVKRTTNVSKKKSV